jgi:hypothetical protein
MKLLAHMKKTHPKSELLTAKVLACPFCQEELPQRKLQRLKHVGSHMEKIVLTEITRVYEDWTSYSDSEKYLSSASTEEQQQENKVAETLNLPSAPSESPAAPEESNTAQTKANTSPPIAKEASEMGEASDARQVNQGDEFGGPKSAKETKELPPEARQVHTEFKSTQPLASTEEDRFFPPTSRENMNISKREAREVDTELKSTQPSAPEPRANPTGPSEQMARTLAKKDRPRVKRTANASSWADWGVSNQL